MENEKELTAEMKLLKAVFGCDTVNECYNAVNKISEVTNGKLLGGFSIGEYVYALVYREMKEEAVELSKKIERREEKIKKLTDLKCPQIIIDNENLILHQQQGMLHAYKRIAELVSKMGYADIICKNKAVLSQLLEVLASKDCWNCRYYIGSVKEYEDGEETSAEDYERCLKGCENLHKCEHFDIEDDYKPFWFVKREVMHELNAEDINDQNVIEESMKRVNAKRESQFAEEATR